MGRAIRPGGTWKAADGSVALCDGGYEHVRPV